MKRSVVIGFIIGWLLGSIAPPSAQVPEEAPLVHIDLSVFPEETRTEMSRLVRQINRVDRFNYEAIRHLLDSLHSH